MYVIIAVLGIMHNPLHCVYKAEILLKLCLQPPQSGRCFGYVSSFAYNPIARKCEEFIYGGCGGNDNRFDTKMECELTCRDV
ncbi:chymotrypsin inhibitor SCI-II isoform X2 [Ceratitis capitata]|uniref:chymotrypsin inhibitor SCI-II isoform X2 n=1 Tax=Ceratitis capitata TaxID=7213 RepID=UPI000A10AFF9|nr:chymotrypsin inhibitor SCI-II isoform X2 [Ceratitis capitata]